MPYCRNCGNEAAPGDEFCRKCGQRLRDESIGDEIGREFSAAGREIEKEFRAAGDEIGDSIRKGIIVESIPEVRLIEAIFGGLVIVLLGTVLYLAASGIISYVEWKNFWAFFLLGLGVLLLLKGVAEYFIRPARGKAYGDLQGGLILGLIGGTFVTLLAGGDWSRNWPIFLVIIGVAIVFVAVLAYAAKVLVK